MGGIMGRMYQEAKNQDQEALEPEAHIERMDRVAVLFAEITAATREFLAALAQSDRHRDWEDEGFGSCAEWLAWRIGITRGTANEKVRAARALEDLPLISEAMASGELSFSKVRAITRVATPDNESELLEFARAGSAANLERLVRGWKKLSRWNEQQAERVRHSRRRFSVFPDEDGMYVVRGRLDPEVGAALMRAVEAASDALFAETRRERHSPEVPEPAQLRADAVGLLAERALTAGFGAGSGPETGDQAPISGSRAERYQVVLHVEAATLTEKGEPGLSELEDGTRVSAETARRLSCDASRIEVRHDASSATSSANRSAQGSANGSAKRSTHGSTNGAVLDVGRKTRTIPSALRRALDARDRGCRFPGCGLRFTDAHHIVHWADGGETKLGNTVLLCRGHHRRVHEGGYQICSDRNGQVVFFTPKGRALFEVPPMPGLPPNPEDSIDPPDPRHQRDPRDPVEALVRRNRERGISPNSWSGAPKWRRDSDIPWAIEAVAREALDPWDEPSVHQSAGPQPLGYAPSVHEPSVHELSVQKPSVRESFAHYLSAHPSSWTAVSAEIATDLAEVPDLAEVAAVSAEIAADSAEVAAASSFR